MNNPKYSVIVPVYNSQHSLEELTERLDNTFRSVSETYEVLFVDDRSTDESWHILKEIRKKHPGRVRLIRLARNFGQHNATLCGMRFAKGDFIITIDDDLQSLPDDIPLLIREQETSDCDVVYGITSGRKSHNLIRNSGSLLVKKTSKRLRNTPGEGSSFRLIRKNITDKLAEHTSYFAFIDEMLLWHTDSVRFAEVRHLPRKHDQSGYSAAKLLKLVTNLIIFYTDAPLKILSYGGFFASFISFVMAVIFIIKKLFYNVPLGYTSLIVAILFSTSIILFSLGIIGEYLSRIYKVQNRKPPYSIQTVLD